MYPKARVFKVGTWVQRLPRYGHSVNQCLCKEITYLSREVKEGKMNARNENDGSGHIKEVQIGSTILAKNL